jgi:hypothetical protein
MQFNGQPRRAKRRNSIVSPRMRDLPVNSVPLVLRLVAAGARAKSRRIALQKKLNIAKQTQLRQTWIAISLITAVL